MEQTLGLLFDRKNCEILLLYHVQTGELRLNSAKQFNTIRRKEIWTFVELNSAKQFNAIRRKEIWTFVELNSAKQFNAIRRKEIWTFVELYSAKQFNAVSRQEIWTCVELNSAKQFNAIPVVFDRYPSDVNGNSVKSAEGIRRANLHSSHEIIFNEATCPETSQEQFLANERNKVRFIDLLKKFLQKANVTVKQTVKDADVLIVETAVSVKSQYDNIFVVGEGIDLLVLLTGLAPMKENL
ncbi:hypothetical protein AVEN_271090-1 [Araneus ventricosus]|uniref:Uncharacterized protein n=1 Tax=Araneus ventricosus TaxID=182803 RepID=A0A4Y2KA08_ARAVE|nr:hypothetical protein AVEN_271090-1 [Araneus ventricosus]